MPFSFVTICATDQVFKSCDLVFVFSPLSVRLPTLELIEFSPTTGSPSHLTKLAPPHTGHTGTQLQDHCHRVIAVQGPRPSTHHAHRWHRDTVVAGSPSRQPKALLVSLPVASTTDHAAPRGIGLGPWSRWWHPPPVPVLSAPASGEMWQHKAVAETDPVPSL